MGHAAVRRNSARLIPTTTGSIVRNHQQQKRRIRQLAKNSLALDLKRKRLPQMAQFRLCWFGILYRGDPDKKFFTLTRTGNWVDNGSRS